MSDKKEKAAAVAAAAKQRVGATLGAIWWAILLRGVLAVGLAICAFVWPEKTLAIFIKLLGAYFLLDGVIGLISAYRSGEKTSPFAQAAVSLTIGMILLLWTGVSGKVFLILVGVWLVLQRFSLFYAAFRMSSTDEQRGLVMVIGGVMTLIGLMFVFWTDTGVIAISWLIGLGAMIIGILLIYLATVVKRLQAKIDSIGSSAA